MKTAETKNGLRRILAILLTAVMLVMQLPMGVFAVDSLGEGAVLPEISEGETGEIKMIALGESVKVTGETTFLFIPEETGVYRIYSSDNGDSDPVCTLYDANFEQLAYNDDSGSLNFEINCQLEAGEIYYIEASSYGETCSYILNVAESDILSLEYVSGGEYEFIEYDPSAGYWNCTYNEELVDRYFSYEGYRVLEDIVIKVNYKDGSSELVTLYDEEGNWYGISAEWDFYKNPWKVGNDNKLDICYKGMKTTIDVTVVESPVKSIEVIEKGNDTFVEHDEAKGYWSKYFEEIELKEEFFQYDTYYFSEELVLKVTYKDGTVEEVPYYSEQGDWNGIRVQSFQYFQPWTVGSDNEYEIWYKGAYVKEYATIVENTVESISLFSGGKYEYVEFNEADGYWNGNQYGEFFHYYTERVINDIVINVIHKDGTTEQVSYQDGGIMCEHNQYEKPWTVGNDNHITVKYMGASFELPVTVKPGLVESVSVSDMTVTEGTNGAFYQHMDESHPEFDVWYQYDAIFPTDITVNLSDGRVLKGDMEYIESELGVNIRLDYHQNYDNQWGIGAHEVTINVMGKTTTFNYIIEESDVASISVEELTTGQHQNGYWYDGYWDYGDWIEGEWFCYEFNQQKITITYKDGSTFTGTAWEIEQETGIYPHFFSNQSYHNQWELGTYNAKVFYAGKIDNFTVTITEGELEGIEVIDTNDFVYYKEDQRYGSWDVTNEGEKFFYYSTWYLAQNITIRVYYKDGTTEDISFYDEYQNETGIEVNHSQYSRPWSLGGENKVTVTYKGAKTKISAILEETPVESIIVEPMTIVEGTNGEWYTNRYEENGELIEEKYFRYYITPNYLTVNFKDGTKVSGTYDELWNLGYEFGLDSDQDYDTPWTVGTNTAIVSTLGFSCEFIITITESPVDSIIVEDITTLQGIGGYWTYHNEDGGVAHKYFLYNLYPERITINLKDGTKVSGTYDELWEMGYYFQFSSDQSYYNQWGVGTHTATATLMGCTAEYNVTITASPIESISVKPVNIVKETNGSWYTDTYEQDGEIVERSFFRYEVSPQEVTITYTDGRVVTCKYEDIYYNTGYHPSYESDQGYDNPWYVGAHTATMTIMGAIAEYTVNILDTPIQSIEIEPIETIEGTGGNWHSHSFDNGSEEILYYCYNVEPQNIKITYKDGTVLEGTLNDIYDATGIFPNYYSDQNYDNIWGAGSYTATFEMQGFTTEYTINVIETPVASIEVEPLKYIEGTNGSWYYYTIEQDGQEISDRYFRYSVYPGDVKVTYKDGTVFEGALNQLEADTGYGYHYFSNQNYDNVWEAGNHYATFVFMGVYADYGVTITETPVESIYVEPLYLVKDQSGWENNGYYDEEGWWQEGNWFEYNTYPRQITVYYKDGTVFRGDFEEFRWQGYEIEVVSDQSYNNQWDVGSHTLHVNGIGFAAECKVYIVEEKISGDYTYGVLPDGTAIILHYDGTDTNLVIPEKIDGYEVSVIKGEAFPYCNTVETLTIPNTVKHIDVYAFYYLSNLHTIKLGGGVEVIGVNAFFGCYNIQQVVYSGTAGAKEMIAVYDYNDNLNEAEWLFVSDCDEHVYDNDCDAQCNNCYAVREVTHDYHWVIDSEASCMVDGYKHEECLICKASSGEVEIIPAVGEHINTYIVNDYPETCGQFGYSGDVYCYDCGQLVSWGHEIEPNGDHRNTDIVGACDPTCGYEGYTGDIYCYDCNMHIYLGETIPATGAHINTGIINEREAYCGNSGYTGDLYCYDCYQIIEYGEEIAASDKHSNLSLVGASSPTCGEDGYTGDLWCLHCKTLVEEGESIPATGKHVYSNAYDANCNECGEIREVDDLTLPELTIMDSTAYLGETVRVDLKIDNNIGFAALQLGVIYDSKYFTLVDVESCMPDFYVTVGNSIVFDSIANYSEDGVIATLIFKVAENAPVGDYGFQLRFMSASNENFEVVQMITYGGTITVESAISGDANGDGKVDTIDLVMLRKYLANMDPETMTSDIDVKKGADANGDGIVDAIDLAFVRKLLASQVA